MKKIFNKDYILSEKGCYTRGKVLSLKCINNSKITLKNLFDELPIKDFIWFLFKKCELNKDQKIRLCLDLSKSVEYIYNKKYPNDNRVKDCNETAELYLKGKISKSELMYKSRYAAAAADAADASTADSAAASAAADSAAISADAAAITAAISADSGISAAAAADAAGINNLKIFKINLWKLLKKY